MLPISADKQSVLLGLLLADGEDTTKLRIAGNCLPINKA
jgi:hypothetical protein